MRVITKPTVRVIGHSTFVPHPTYELPPDGTFAERLIATAGKVCYDSYGCDGRPVVEHVRNLVRQRHGSVLEHVTVTVFIEGISRGCSHELVRHRHLSFSQRSTRYTAEEGSAIVLEPYLAELWQRAERGTIPLLPEEHRALSEAMASAQRDVEAYARLVATLRLMAPADLSPTEKRKWARGKARQSLPHALETRLVVTGNLRAWRDFFLQRTSRHAEAEIRRLAEVIYERVASIAPHAFADLTHSVVGDFLELSGERV
jgi:thymidylate synthase (FAD)